MKSNIQTICAAMILSIVICIGILGSTPPVARDSLTHHLYVPKLYLKHGGIYEITSIEFSYYPMNLEMLYIAALYWGNDILPKYIHFTFALLTAWLIYTYLKSRLNKPFAIYGVLLFLAVPMVVKLSITAYVDLGLIFFSMMSIFYLLKWIEKDFQLKYLILSAVGCGLGVGTKYNGLITLFLLTLFVPYSYAHIAENAKNSMLRPLGYGIIYLFAALIMFSPWMMRNIAWKHNPIYPLYNSWFSPQMQNSGFDSLSEDNDAVTKPVGPFLIRKFVFHETWWRTALIPIRIFFEGKDDDPAHFDGRLTPLLFILPLFAFFNIRKKSWLFRYELRIFLAFSILFLLYAFFTTDMRIRYISPIIPALVVLSVTGLFNVTAWVRDSFPTQKRIWIQIIIWGIVLPLFPIGYLIGQFDAVKAISYLSGRINRDDYITRFRPEYPSILFANQYLPQTAKILAIFLGNRGYYFDRDVAFDMKLPIPKNGNDAFGESIAMALHREGITHLLIRYDLFNRWVSERSDGEREILARFFKNQARLLFSSGGHGLFALQE